MQHLTNVVMQAACGTKVAAMQAARRKQAARGTSVTEPYRL